MPAKQEILQQIPYDERSDLDKEFMHHLMGLRQKEILDDSIPKKSAEEVVEDYRQYMVRELSFREDVPDSVVLAKLLEKRRVPISSAVRICVMWGQVHPLEGVD